jgi:hypothetical protein
MLTTRRAGDGQLHVVVGRLGEQFGGDGAQESVPTPARDGSGGVDQQFQLSVTE